MSDTIISGVSQTSDTSLSASKGANDVTSALPPAVEAEAKDYIALMKPRVMTLVVFTALIGMIAAPGDFHPVLGAAGILLIAIGAGASAALNMWYDADIDLIMARTAGRPVPSGKVKARDALSFGIVLSVFSVLLLGLIAGLVPALLLAITIFFYAFIYTVWLKRRTNQNIVIGGAAGAFPPMIGWAVVTNSVTIESMVLFLIVFFWTPAHFWALSLFVNQDYSRAGVPMLTVTNSRQSVSHQILLYAILAAITSVLPSILGFASPVYGVIAAILGGLFIWKSINVVNTKDGGDRSLFLYSINYLFILFGALGLDIFINNWISV